MATLLKTTFKNELPVSGSINVPELYVDSINSTSYLTELHNYCAKFIRTNTDSETESKSRLVKDEKEISTKDNGYWYTFDEKSQTITMYKKSQSLGYIYNSSIVEKVFTMTYVKCPKVVPKVFTEKNIFNDFSQELKEKVLSRSSLNMKI